MPLPTRRSEGILTLEDESRFVFSGVIKTKPLIGLGSIRVAFEEVPPLVGNFVDNNFPLVFLRRRKLKFLPSLLRSKKILLTTISNVVNIFNAFLIEIDVLRMGEAVF